MSESDDFDLERLAALSEELGEYVTALKRAVVEDDGDGLLETADDLWDVLDEIEDVLATIDFEELPDAIDFEDLPETVDVEDVPEGLLDEDESAIELSNVREAVNLRELWDAVDLTQLRQEKQELASEMDDIADDESSDEDDDELFENVVEMGEGAHVQSDAEIRQAFLEEKILEAVEAFRSALLTAHEKLRKLYKANQEKLGQPGRQPDSLNPSAASTMPPGPIPDSASSRASTVPSQVRYSRVENPRRIYGRRFSQETRDAADADVAESDPEAEGDSGSDPETADADADADDVADSGAEADSDDGGKIDLDPDSDPDEGPDDGDEAIELEVHNG